jgi:hypothetical protein
MRLYLLAALTLALIGCASSGPKIDAPRLSEVRKGETTVTDIVREFGRPSVLSKNMDGTQTAAYMHVEGRSDAGAFGSLITALAGNQNANVDSVIFYFDVKGVLSDYKTTQANARTPAPANAEKPALATGEKTTPASAEKTPHTTANKPTQADRKSTPGDSNPWTIQLYPSGYRENR